LPAVNQGIDTACNVLYVRDAAPAARRRHLQQASPTPGISVGTRLTFIADASTARAQTGVNAAVSVLGNNIGSTIASSLLSFGTIQAASAAAENLRPGNKSIQVAENALGALSSPPPPAQLPPPPRSKSVVVSFIAFLPDVGSADFKKASALRKYTNLIREEIRKAGGTTAVRVVPGAATQRGRPGQASYGVVLKTVLQFPSPEIMAARKLAASLKSSKRAAWLQGSTAYGPRATVSGASLSLT